MIAGYNADGLFYCNWGWNGKSHLNGFETGLYYVRVSSEGISVTEKIIVL